jgi:glucose/arabinose dehydrogenase
MKRLTLTLLCSLILFSACSSQPLPPTVQMTPIRDLGLQVQQIHVPAKYSGVFPGDRTLSVPAGYTVSLFHAGGLSKPRFFAWSPDSVLHVADKNAGTIIALPDKDHDGVADAAIVVASGFSKSHDMKFYNGALYVAEETKVTKCIDANGDGTYETKSTFITMVTGGQQGGGGHDTRTIVFDPAKKKMYLSIGSLCNACREEERAIIEEWNDDGTGRRVFATGCRNAVGMTLHNGRLWANNNGFDWQGDDIPPEWIDIVRDGGFYGYPYAYGHGLWVNFSASGDYQALLPLTAKDSANVRSMKQPAALIQAHSAPMAIEFSNPSFPPQFRNGAFTALRGSWNRKYATGFKIVYLDFDNSADTTANYVADFVRGFLTDSVGKKAWGRPVGVETDSRGNLYIGIDDLTECILLVSPNAPTKVKKTESKSSSPLGLLRNYPNPFNPVTDITFTLTESVHTELAVFDVAGKTVKQLINERKEAGTHTVQFDGSQLPSGTYFATLRAGESVETNQMSLLK